MNSDGSSSRTAHAGNTLSVMGTVTCLPVRSSTMVMVSGMLFPSMTQVVVRGLLPCGGDYPCRPRTIRVDRSEAGDRNSESGLRPRPGADFELVDRVRAEGAQVAPVALHAAAVDGGARPGRAEHQ